MQRDPKSLLRTEGTARTRRSGSLSSSPAKKREQILLEDVSKNLKWIKVVRNNRHSFTEGEWFLTAFCDGCMMAFFSGQQAQSGGKVCGFRSALSCLSAAAPFRLSPPEPRIEENMPNLGKTLLSSIGQNFQGTQVPLLSEKRKILFVKSVKNQRLPFTAVLMKS